MWLCVYTKYSGHLCCLQFNILIPITFMICVIFLLVVPLYAAPADTGMGLVIVCSGIPVYIVGVAWKRKPAAFNRFVREFHFIFTAYSIIHQGTLHPMSFTRVRCIPCHSPGCAACHVIHQGHCMSSCNKVHCISCHVIHQGALHVMSCHSLKCTACDIIHQGELNTLSLTQQILCIAQFCYTRIFAFLLFHCFIKSK